MFDIIVITVIRMYVDKFISNCVPKIVLIAQSIPAAIMMLMATPYKIDVIATIAKVYLFMNYFSFLSIERDTNLHPAL